MEFPQVQTSIDESQDKSTESPTEQVKQAEPHRQIVQWQLTKYYYLCKVHQGLGLIIARACANVAESVILGKI